MEPKYDLATIAKQFFEELKAEWELYKKTKIIWVALVAGILLSAIF